MSLDRIVPARKATVRTGIRFSVPRGLTAGTLAAVALTWALYAIQPGASLLSAQVQTGIFLGLLLLTICSRRAKVLLARIMQRFILNPLFRLLFAIGLNPLGLAILETRGTLPARSAGSRSATAVRATRSGSSPSTAPAPATCATSSTTPMSGCGCVSDCATAGCPASPPSVPTTIRSSASGASSPGTRCAR